MRFKTRDQVPAATRREFSSKCKPVICSSAEENAMQSIRNLGLFILCLLVMGASLALAEKPVEDSRGWPRLFESEGRRVVVYQPQLDEWENRALLRARAAHPISSCLGTPRAIPERTSLRPE